MPRDDVGKTVCFMDKCGRTIWKIKHPQLMVDTKGMLENMELYVTAQDFSHEEVRQRKFEIIEEICNRYDIDGFELDYIRHPAFFSETLRGLPATLSLAPRPPRLLSGMSGRRRAGIKKSIGFAPPKLERQKNWSPVF